MFCCFENLKNDVLSPKIEGKQLNNTNPHDRENVALYVLTYNSPRQFEKLCLSFETYDNNFLDKPKKYLLNNSIDRSTDLAYTELCDRYGFEEIKNTVGMYWNNAKSLNTVEIKKSATDETIYIINGKEYTKEEMKDKIVELDGAIEMNEDEKSGKKVMAITFKKE